MAVATSHWAVGSKVLFASTEKMGSLECHTLPTYSKKLFCCNRQGGVTANTMHCGACRCNSPRPVGYLQRSAILHQAAFCGLQCDLALRRNYFLVQEPSVSPWVQGGLPWPWRLFKKLRVK